MKLRFAIAAFLLVVGIALPLAAVAKRGVPWGFRGHQAVLLEATGTVELMASEDRRAREKREDGHLPATPGIFLDSGDEVRVARYSEARVRFDGADIAVGDGGRIVLGAGKTGFTLARGVVDVSLKPGTIPFEVKIEGMEATLTVRSGGEGAQVRILADGAGEVRALARQGSVQGSTAVGEEMAETGQVLVVTNGQKPAHEAAPTKLAMIPICDVNHLRLTVGGGTQVFVAGSIQYPKGDKVELDVKGVVTVFARDIAGNVAKVEACGAPAVPGKPGRPLAPTVKPTPTKPTAPGAPKAGAATP